MMIPEPAMLSEQDERHLRRAFALAQSSRDSGNRPFGALLGRADGKVFAEGVNDVLTTGDVTDHAEMQVVRRIMASPVTDLDAATLYASTEPCVMCTGALFLAGIERIVFGFPGSGVRELSGPVPQLVNLPFGASFVLESAKVDVEVIGPALRAEALAVHQGFWDA